MYIAFLIVLGGLGLGLLAVGWRRGRSVLAALGALALLASFTLPGLWSFWAEWLWYDALGQGGRFWTQLRWEAIALLGGALGAALPVALLVRRTPAPRPLVVRLVPLVAALGGAALGAGAWQTLALAYHGGASGVTEPVFGRDASFYLFRLPLYDRLYGGLVWTVACGLFATLWSYFRMRPDGSFVPRREFASPLEQERARLPVLLAAAFAGLVLAWGAWLERYELLYSEHGVLTGPGWTDVHVRAPAYAIGAVLIALLTALPLVSSLRRIGALRRGEAVAEPEVGSLSWAATSWVAVGLVWLTGLWGVPQLVQWLVVVPREISYEKPYLADHIRFTREAFGLARANVQPFDASPRLDRATLERYRPLLDEVRLWDWRALLEVYDQFQELRLYYDFHDVDIDRYRFGGRYRQVMVSARELDITHLPARNRTFINRRFKYTHGYGITLAGVSEVTPEGLPHLLVSDIPPRAEAPELAVRRPEIYYGERTVEPVVVASREPEFDYPHGSDNVYTRYTGRGGVAFSNFWRRVVFGWKFDGTPLLLSSYLEPTSRMMWRRTVRERVAALAPFLTLDTDPYVVLAEGRLYWVIDAYTTSSHYPYSAPFRARETIPLSDGETISDRPLEHLDGANYVRNAVKAVVDAYEGTVQLYVFDPADPVIAAWQRVFPGLFRPADAMPAALRAHVRYPHELLLCQGLMAARYHMTDPEVFYNQEDLWVRATENYAGSVVPVEPYYVMWQRPGRREPEMAVILPFTPKGRQVLVGWIAGLCDGPDYGKLLTYLMPKDRTVLGPQQVESKIDQDGDLRRVLTLWESSGSEVIRGNVLAIPLGRTLLYVEPIFLRARTAAYPELRLVVVMHGERLGWGRRLEQALEHLLGGAPPPEPVARTGPPPTPSVPAPQPVAATRTAGPVAASAVHALAAEANAAFERYLALQAERRFTEAAEQLERLEHALRRLLETTTPAQQQR
ncbi:MAG: UPF0182 family protein [Planctomycetota bacterium]|nr:MAG: UPF0182 family protein [Planctomycetota bacterium]